MPRLFEKLEAYSQTDFYPFHMPGHKRNYDTIDGNRNFPFHQDITEIDGFDNLHHAEDILLQAQRDVAELYGVKESFYSVNGSTAGLLSAVSAAVKKGGKMLVARNCHKAVYHAMYLRDIEPIYLYPPMEPKFRINGGILPEDVENSLKNDREIQAVLITSPTYDGVVSDVKKIAEIVHSYGIPLIVDEAHGAHFAFHSYFPVSAIYSGADLVVQSFHKTLPSMTQTAVLHRCSDRVSREKISRFLGVYQSSSPSYILMASMDACTAKLKKDGHEMFGKYIENLKKTRENLKKCSNLKMIPCEIKGQYGIFDYDCSKILISTLGTNLNGNILSDILRTRYHLEMEMAEENYITALTSVGDTEAGFNRLCYAICEIDKESERIIEKQTKNRNTKKVVKKQRLIENHGLEMTLECQKTKIPDNESMINAEVYDCSVGTSKRDSENQLCIPLEQKLRISDALEADTISCPLKESEGRISAEFAYFYPPGIPIVTPGEMITEHLLKKIENYVHQGFSLQGLSDHTGRNIFVVNNRDN